MLLKKLIKKTPKNIRKIDIKSLTSDSRKVKNGYLFFAVKGTKVNGEIFINEAIRRGASAVVCSKTYKSNKNSKIIIKVKDVKKTLAYACSQFFNLKPKNIIAVTGTNGKSSVAEFYRQILLLNNLPVASIGTLGIRKKNNYKKTPLTTLDTISIHQELYNLKKSKIDNVIIEASSHGLSQRRLDGIRFQAGVFTNISQDHMDYHKNMKNYFNSKMILFSELLNKKKHIIIDNSIKEFKKVTIIAKRKKLKLLSIGKKKADISILNNTIKGNYQKISLVYKGKNYKFDVPLVGFFQIKNLLMSILASRLTGLKFNRIISCIKKLSSVEGRLQLIKVLPNKTKIFIDYAHTPEALETAIKSLKRQYNSKVILVFGCGGERDKKKRPIMGKIAKDNAFKIYVTDDNPRKENAKKIRREITKSLNNANFFEIGDRNKAISQAIKQSEPDSIILIAGKGHESTQDYGNKILQRSDKETAKFVKVSNFKSSNSKIDEAYNSRILNKIINKKKIINFKGISIDSKKIKKGNLFVAIKGTKKDGHNYVMEALKKGAKYSIVSKKMKKFLKNKVIQTNNTNSFLNIFAKFKREETKAKIIAVTGSAGKTTVKTLLGEMLKNYGKTFYSPKSYNNHYGVPLSLSNLENSHKFGVFEIGMSKAGEILKLSKLVKPEIGIITNVGEAHIENFKNIKGVAKAKGEIIQNITSEGTVILNRDCKFFSYFKKLADRRKIQTLSFGRSKKSDVSLSRVIKRNNKNILKILICKKIISVNVRNLDNVNIENILCSLAVLKKLDLSLKKIKTFFRNLESVEGRGKMHNIRRYKTNFRLIDESYNANPLSVKKAIINFSKIKKNNFKKYILLGDMLELGDKSDFYHKNLSKVINNTDIDKIFVYGDKIFTTYKHTNKKKRGNILQNREDFDEVFSNLIKKNDHLMIKGSNATGLNKLSKNIIKEHRNVV